MLKRVALACGVAFALAAWSASDASAAGGGFRVGAATVDINPSYRVYMGGVGGGPQGGTVARHVNPLTGRPEDFSVRAMAIEAGGNVVELERIDSQGYFAGYQEGPYGISDVRQAAAAYLRAHGVPDATEANVIVSALHEHATPTIEGIWGPLSQALPYLQQVAAASIRALERAYDNLRPATLSWGREDAPWLDSTNLASLNANEGWPNDGSLLALWARGAATGQTIATYVSEPAYPNIVFGPEDLKCPKGVDAALLSTDFPSYAQEYLERRLGGTALVASGTLGDQPGPLQGDRAPSRDLPPVTVGGKQCQQTAAFDDAVHMGEILGNLVSEALAHGHEIAAPRVGGAEQYILSPVHNAALLALDEVAPLDGGTPWTELGLAQTVAYPVDRSPEPPYLVGPNVGTWVTGLRIGGVLLLSEPGEFFPSVHQAWDQAVRGADGVFVVGMGQDQLGYDFPAYAYPFTFYSSDQQLYNPSLTLGDQVVLAGEQDAQALGFAGDLTTTAEVSALNNQYQRAAQPGVQLLPFPHSGDVDPRTGGFTTVLEGFATPPRFNRTFPCSPGPYFLPSPPSCPTAPGPTIGPLHWDLGDGTQATTGAGTVIGAGYFSHSYCRPGVYPVRLSATDSNGNSDSFTLPIAVAPALSLTIERVGGMLVANTTGGSGTILYTRWSTPGGPAYGRSIPVPGSAGDVTVTVADGNGTLARATAHYGAAGQITNSRQLDEPPTPLAGPSTGAACLGVRAGGQGRGAQRRACRRVPAVTITLPRRAGLRIRRVTVFVDRRRVASLHGPRHRVRVSLNGRARGAYHVRLVVQTVRTTGAARRGPTLILRRAFHACRSGNLHRRQSTRRNANG